MVLFGGEIGSNGNGVVRFPLLKESALVVVVDELLEAMLERWMAILL